MPIVANKWLVTDEHHESDVNQWSNVEQCAQQAEMNGEGAGETEHGRIRAENLNEWMMKAVFEYSCAFLLDFSLPAD